jgi:hypothetical protein
MQDSNLPPCVLITNKHSENNTAQSSNPQIFIAEERFETIK